MSAAEAPRFIDFWSPGPGMLEKVRSDTIIPVIPAGKGCCRGRLVAKGMVC